MKTKPTVSHTSVLILLASLAAPVPTGLGQGSLTPPPGVPTPNMKTLDQIEARVPVGANTTPGDATRAFIIAAAGSYYLTGNVVAPNGGTGISITAADVTLDLNGYRVAATTAGAMGIVSSGLRTTVRNGVVTSSSRGIQLAGSASVEDLAVVSSQLPALTCGAASSVRQCRITTTGTIGIQVGDGSFIADCRVTGGSTAGIAAGNATVLRGSSVTGAAVGIELLLGSVASDCTVWSCTGDGFRLTQASATRCTARGNGGDGFEAGGGRSLLTECQAAGNTASGFRLNGTGSIRNCVGNSNNTGFRSETGHGLVIQENEFSANSSFGLFINGAAHCRIEGNQIYGNGGAPISLNSNGGHLIIRNTAKANNGGFPSDPSSDIGQVLTNPGNGFVNANPWANIAY